MSFEELCQAHQLWKNKKLGDSQFGLIFFLYYHQEKYPNSKLKSLLEEKKFMSAFEQIKFKKVKQKALISLKNWIEKKWSFILLDHIPMPYEVLRYQAAGVRPVSALLQDKPKKILSKEDGLEFFIHDLEHGHMFFFDEDLKKMQIDFFNKIQLSLGKNIWEEYLTDEKFKENFHYIISDMNTHKEHYRQFLKAIVPIGHFEKFNFLFE